MIKYITLALTLLISTTAHCESADLIYGKSADGSTLAVEATTPNDVWRIKGAGDSMPSEQYKVQFEGCKVVVKTSKTDLSEKRVLYCPQGGVTALSGTQYIGKLVDGKCEQHEPDYIYECVKGCGGKSAAPKLMRQDKKECPQFSLIKLQAEVVER